MATRYSGGIKGRIEYVDSKSQYRVSLTCDGERKVVWVGEPKILTQAVDSPDMYDSTFTAAIAFADLGGEAEYAAEGGHPVKVHRKKPDYWTGK